MPKKVTPKQYARMLNRIPDKLLNDGKMWSKIAEIGATFRKRWIFKKKDFDDKPFVKLKKETIARKRAEGRKHPLKPLVRTGKLAKRAWKWTPGRSIILVDGKAVYHDSESRAKGVPQRKTLGIPQEGKDAIIKHWEIRVKRVLVKLFGK